MLCSPWPVIALLGFVQGYQKVSSIECASGKVDKSNAAVPADLTDALCQQKCSTVCGSVTDDTSLQKCLSDSTLFGCLYNVAITIGVDTSHCLDVNTTSNQTTVVVMATKDHLRQYGETPDETIQDVSIVIELSDTTSSCLVTAPVLLGGISGLEYDSSTCSFAGSPSIKATPRISDANLIISALDLYKAHVGTNATDDLVTYFTMDSSCGSVGDVNVAFSLKYLAGYAASQSCSEIKLCDKCMVAGCHWCSWESSVSRFLPDWLPDWDWVKDARSASSRGNCGLNSAYCAITTGVQDSCPGDDGIGARALFSAVGLGLTIVAIIH